MSTPRYQRILLKLSGEALLGEQGFGIDAKALQRFAAEVASIATLGVQVAIVLGAGNLFRGRSLKDLGVDGVTADQMGMLATVINAIAFRDQLNQHGVQAKVMAAREIPGVAPGFERHLAMQELSGGTVVLCAGGTGNPLVTTDAAASLRAIEIKADILLKATTIDGIYSADPAIDPTAERYAQLTYKEALQKQLAVMDLVAFSQCQAYHLPIRVFDGFESGNLKKIVLGANIGTLVSDETYRV